MLATAPGQSMSTTHNILPGLPQTPYPYDLFVPNYPANFHIQDIGSKHNLFILNTT